LHLPQKYYLEHIFPGCSYAAQCSHGMLVERNCSGGNMPTMISSKKTCDANRPTRRQAIAGVGVAPGGRALFSRAWARVEEEISHSAEAIHQEPVFKATRQRVYEALTTTRQFDKIIQLSGVMQSMSESNEPTDINREVGGPFAVFGGYITGRHLELVPNERIVQAWRVGSWPSGIYSIVKFDLVEHRRTTKIIFDHTGFPQGLAEHLASGWKAHYWDPLEKFLT
jgi:activator of HSP90 ATPase